MKKQRIVNRYYCGMFCCLVMISIDLSETTQKKHTENLRQNSVRDKIRDFFSDNFFFVGLDFVSD